MMYDYTKYIYIYDLYNYKFVCLFLASFLVLVFLM